MGKYLTIMFLVMFAASGVLLRGAGDIHAASVTPIHLEGASNTGKECGDINSSWFQLKVDPVANGVYSDGVLSVTISNYSGTTNSFDWSSNIGVDAVVVKDGVDGANLYRYDPPTESKGDTGLSTPNNGDKGISHISFCYDLEVEVSKTATTSFTRECTWDIDKEASPDTHDLLTGESGSTTYTVTVTKVGCTDSDWVVEGTITVHNPAPIAATVTGVTDTISGGITATVECPSAFPASIPAGGDLVCKYSASLPDGTSRVNTASATTTGAVGSGSGTADITFGDPTKVINGSVNVTDTFQGDLGEFSDTGTAMYSRTFTCDEDEGQHDNTATIVETGQNDSATVTVSCTPPPPTGEWCSPGYWRNHLDAWAATGISPDEKYSAYFGAAPKLTNQGKKSNAPTDPTLFEVVSNPQWYGGDAFNLVGDLLSEAHPDVDFDGTRVEDSCPLN